ncbi:hypothetical protein LZ31DRAFT_121601 [Colletotrichum somersetense]|nr:hypothetical protein LZ31DRAFT_121601 [Colletotrichum somersetense]
MDGARCNALFAVKQIIIREPGQPPKVPNRNRPWLSATCPQRVSTSSKGICTRQVVQCNAVRIIGDCKKCGVSPLKWHAVGTTEPTTQEALRHPDDFNFKDPAPRLRGLVENATCLLLRASTDSSRVAIQEHSSIGDERPDLRPLLTWGIERRKRPGIISPSMYIHAVPC